MKRFAVTLRAKSTLAFKACFMLVLVSLLGSIALAAQPAAASTNTFLWNWSRYVAMRGAPSTDPNVRITHWEPNYMRFQMRCWLDNSGHRWFWGTAWDGNVGFVTAGDTYQQISVPHC